SWSTRLLCYCVLNRTHDFVFKYDRASSIFAQKGLHGLNPQTDMLLAVNGDHRTQIVRTAILRIKWDVYQLMTSKNRSRSIRGTEINTEPHKLHTSSVGLCRTL